MGEARRRGTQADRISAAKSKSPETIEASDTGTGNIDKADHFCFVLDAGAASSQMVARLAVEYPAIIDRYVLLNDLGKQFMLFFFSTKAKGQMTIFSANEEALLDEGLPHILAKSLEIGGFCAVMSVLEEDLNQRVMARFAELQPTTGGMAN